MSIVLQESSEGEDKQFRYGVAAMQGWRASMVNFPSENLTPSSGNSLHSSSSEAQLTKLAYVQPYPVTSCTQIWRISPQPLFRVVMNYIETASDNYIHCHRSCTVRSIMMSAEQV